MKEIMSHPKEANILDNISSQLETIKENIRISKYSKKEHKKGEYPDDFIYIYDKNNDEIYILIDLDLSYFDTINDSLSDKDFDIFCYSKENTQTMYNSYKPVGDSFQLIIKAKIDNLLDL